MLQTHLAHLARNHFVKGTSINWIFSLIFSLENNALNIPIKHILKYSRLSMFRFENTALNIPEKHLILKYSRLSLTIWPLSEKQNFKNDQPKPFTTVFPYQNVTWFHKPIFPQVNKIFSSQQNVCRQFKQTTSVQSLVPTSQKEAKYFLMSVAHNILDISVIEFIFGRKRKWCQIESIWGDTSKNPAASH